MDDRKTTAVCFRPPHVVYTQTHTHTDTHTWEHHQQQQALSAFNLKFNSERQRRVSWVMSSQRHTKQFDVIGAKLTFPLFFFLFDLSSVNPRSKTHTRTQYVYTQNKTTTVDCSNSQHSVLRERVFYQTKARRMKEEKERKRRRLRKSGTLREKERER